MRREAKPCPFYGMPCEYVPMAEKAQDRIEQLEAEVLTWQGHAKTAIWGDSEECKSLSAEVDRLVRSRNKWGQRYNKLLLKIRAGESGETDDPASWQLRMALDDANVKNDEAAARIEQLEAALAMFACDCTVSERCAIPDNCYNFQVRRTLEERT